jgi:hypothetical protein
MIVIIISYYYILLFDRSRKQIKKYALDLLCEGNVSLWLFGSFRNLASSLTVLLTHRN